MFLSMNYLDKKHSGFFSVLEDENVSIPRFGWLKSRVIWSETVSEGAKDGLGASRLRQTTPQYAIYCSPICHILVGNLRHIASQGMALFTVFRANALIIRHLCKTLYFAIFSTKRHPASKYTSFRGGVFGIIFTIHTERRSGHTEITDIHRYLSFPWFPWFLCDKIRIITGSFDFFAVLFGWFEKMCYICRTNISCSKIVTIIIM